LFGYIKKHDFFVVEEIVNFDQKNTYIHPVCGSSLRTGLGAEKPDY